jgi:DNA (cytosine-5)-methyltransferase 1
VIGIDLFSGAGGMSLGAEMSGIRVVAAVEANPHAAQTYVRNHSGVQMMEKRIEHISPKDFDLDRRTPLVMFGGPPCRGFSTSNQRTRSSQNPDNWLFTHYIRLARALEPEWLVFENVTGILQTEGGRFVQAVATSLDSIGYSTVQWVLNAVDFGVPQRRSRLFLVGTRCGVRVRQPCPHRHRPTVADAISDLPRLESGATKNWMEYACPPQSRYARQMRGQLTRSANHLVTRNQPIILKRYSFVPQGGNWKSIPRRLMRNYSDPSRCHEWIYLRLRPDEPSVVIGNYRKNMLIHPWQDRGLSVREAARLQSFPDWFQFIGSIGFQQQQVGNAVPPLLARAVFTAIIRASK